MTQKERDYLANMICQDKKASAERGVAFLVIFGGSGLICLILHLLKIL
jgi:hypothetical protein